MAQNSDQAEGGGSLERHARTLFDNMAEGLVICEALRDAEGRLIDYLIRDANPIFLKRSVEGPDAIGRSLLSMRPGTSPWWFQRCEDALRGAEVRFEFEDPLSHRWYDVHMMQLSGEEFGQFFMDISHRKAAEARQTELFAELNHRVKNNLAMVSSILELQARGASADVRAHLEKAIGRVRTVSDLHSALYQQNSTEQIDLCPYLEGLCAALRTALFQDTQVRLDARCAAVTVAAREAVSLGLIVNELVTNAAKHAFVGRPAGKVEVVLEAVGRGVRLRVADDGVGASRESRSGGLGLRLVRSLVAGLDGDLELQAGPGLAAEITIAEV